MNVTLTTWHQSAACGWCDRTKECVTAEFADGFLTKGPLCWLCLQKAVRARNRQQGKSEQAEPCKAS